MLTVEGLRSRYGRIEVLHGLDLEVRSGEIVTVVGANGAGKTTLLRCLSGTQPASEGSIVFRGENLARVPAHRRLARGLAQSPEGRQIFTNLSVEENLRLGAFLYSDERVDRDMADAFAMFPILKEKRNLAAGGLSGGQQQMLAIARALMGRPHCLLLDEPISALDVKHQVETLRLVHRLAEERELTVIVVLHDVDLAARFCDRLVALKGGRLIADGSPRDIMDSGILESIYGVPMGVMERAPGQWVSYVH